MLIEFCYNNICIYVSMSRLCQCIHMGTKLSCNACCRGVYYSGLFDTHPPPLIFKGLIFLLKISVRSKMIKFHTMPIPGLVCHCPYFHDFKTGILLFFDFEKAFDSVSFTYIYSMGRFLSLSLILDTY